MYVCNLTSYDGVFLVVFYLCLLFLLTLPFFPPISRWKDSWYVCYIRKRKLLCERRKRHEFQWIDSNFIFRRLTFFICLIRYRVVYVGRYFGKWYCMHICMMLRKIKIKNQTAIKLYRYIDYTTIVPMETTRRELARTKRVPEIWMSVDVPKKKQSIASYCQITLEIDLDPLCKTTDERRKAQENEKWGENKKTAQTKYHI